MQKLIEEGQVDFGGESSIKVNMDKLVDQLKRDNLDFKRGHRSGMPATSKKYKWLHKLVAREAKKENGQDQDEDAEQLDVESSAMSFKSVQGLHNCDTASGFFRNDDDMPPTHHS